MLGFQRWKSWNPNWKKPWKNHQMCRSWNPTGSLEKNTQKIPTKKWPKVEKSPKIVDLEKILLLQNLHLIAKIGFNTAENGPRQVRYIIKARETWFGIVSVPGSQLRRTAWASPCSRQLLSWLAAQWPRSTWPIRMWSSDLCVLCAV